MAMRLQGPGFEPSVTHVVLLAGVDPPVRAAAVTLSGCGDQQSLVRLPFRPCLEVFVSSGRDGTLSDGPRLTGN